LLANLLTAGILAMIHLLHLRLTLTPIFISQALLVSGAAAYYAHVHRPGDFMRWRAYLKKALAFAWPIILNSFLFMFINNYGKIYARNFLSQEEMFQLSFVQRVALFIQLMHLSLIGYLSKRLYIDRRIGINPRLTLVYSIMLAGAVMAVIAFFAGLRIFHVPFAVELNLVTFLIIGFTVAWCYAGYFEMYVNRMNKNRYILLFSALSALVFIAVLLLPSARPLVTIALSMQAGMLVNLVLILGFLLPRGRGESAEEGPADFNGGHAV